MIEKAQYPEREAIVELGSLDCSRLLECLKYNNTIGEIYGSKLAYEAAMTDPGFDDFARLATINMQNAFTIKNAHAEGGKLHILYEWSEELHFARRGLVDDEMKGILLAVDAYPAKDYVLPKSAE